MKDANRLTRKFLRVLLHGLPYAALLALFAPLEFAFGHLFGVWGAAGGLLLVFIAAPFIHLAMHSWRRVVWRLAGGEPWRKYDENHAPPTPPAR